MTRVHSSTHTHIYHNVGELKVLYVYVSLNVNNFFNREAQCEVTIINVKKNQNQQNNFKFQQKFVSPTDTLKNDTAKINDTDLSCETWRE